MCVCVCVCVSSLQHFDMIKDKKYGLFKTYFYSYNTFPTDNLLIVKPLKVLHVISKWLLAKICPIRDI